MMREDKRIFDRMPVDLRVRETAPGHRARARAVDLSVLGMRYLKPANEPRPPDREVMLEFCLPGELRSIKVRGWIVDERPLGRQRSVSVTFAYLKSGDAQKVCRHLGDANA